MSTVSETIRKTIDGINTLDERAMAAARMRQDRLTKPQGSLGILEDLSIKIAGIQGKEPPKIKHKAIIIMAGDHGVVAEKVGNWPQDVTTQMVMNFLNGGGGIKIFFRQNKIRGGNVGMGVA
jgi:nicotinate-nucleotide--dimethylbenzimidazole phosphoribosyltransferase